MSNIGCLSITGATPLNTHCNIMPSLDIEDCEKGAYATWKQFCPSFFHMKRECVPRTDCIKSERIRQKADEKLRAYGYEKIEARIPTIAVWNWNVHLSQSVAAGSNKLEKRVVRIHKDLRSRMGIECILLQKDRETEMSYFRKPFTNLTQLVKRRSYPFKKTCKKNKMYYILE